MEYTVYYEWYKRLQNKTVCLALYNHIIKPYTNSIYCCLALLITLTITMTLYLIKQHNYKCWLTLAMHDMKPNRQLDTLQLPIILATFFETCVWCWTYSMATWIYMSVPGLWEAESEVLNHLNMMERLLGVDCFWSTYWPLNKDEALIQPQWEQSGICSQIHPCSF